MSSTKRIAFVVSGKSPKTMSGGLGSYAFNSAKIFADLGYKVIILGYSTTDEVVDLDFAKLVHLKTPFGRFLGLGVPQIAPSFETRMKEIVLREEPEQVLIFSVGAWGLAAVRLKIALKHSKCKIRTMVAYFTTYRHEYMGHRLGAIASDYGWLTQLAFTGLYQFVKIYHAPKEHWMLRNSDRILVHYESTKKILMAEVNGLKESAIRQIPYFIDLYDREGLDPLQEIRIEKKDRPTIAVICRQDPRKGINFLLHAVKTLHQRGCSFDCVIAGSGIFLRKNKKLASKLGLDTIVQFCGFVPSTEILLKSADIFVLPSLEEGSGSISLLEAMKEGIAIVTTYCDGIPEDLTHNESAILTEPGNPTALADGIEKLIKDKEFRKELGQNAKRRYESRFGFEKMKQGIESILNELFP